MSHIVSCEITGLAGRADTLTFKFDRHLNVFFGLNGSGKTSLLKILNSAMSLDGSLLRQVYFRAARVTLYSITHNRDFTVILEKPVEEHDSQAELPLGVPDAASRRRGELQQPELQWQYLDAIPQIKDTKSWHHRYLPTTRLYLAPFGRYSPPDLQLEYGARTSMYSEESLERLFATSLTYLWQSQSSEIYSGVRNAQATGLANILRDVLAPPKSSDESVTLKDRQTTRRRVENFLRRQGRHDWQSVMADFDSQFQSDPRVQRVVADIDAVETSIEAAMKPIRDLSALLSQLYSGGKQVVVSERGISVFLPDRRKLALDNLSSGEKHVLRMFVDALFCAESTLMIDEPELSLHVDWQRALIRHLKTLNEDMQLVIATHSPEVMADVPDDNIFRL